MKSEGIEMVELSRQKSTVNRRSFGEVVIGSQREGKSCLTEKCLEYAEFQREEGI